MHRSYFKNLNEIVQSPSQTIFWIFVHHMPNSVVLHNEIKSWKYFAKWNYWCYPSKESEHLPNSLMAKKCLKFYSTFLQSQNIFWHFEVGKLHAVSAQVSLGEQKVSLHVAEGNCSWGSKSQACVLLFLFPAVEEHFEIWINVLNIF